MFGRRAHPSTWALRRCAQTARSPVDGCAPAERLPDATALHAARLAAVAATTAVAVVCARCTSQLVAGSCPLAALGAAVALQCASVAAAAETATKGVSFRRRNALLWLHATFSTASLAALSAMAVTGVRLAGIKEVRIMAGAAVAFTCWAVLNGTIAFVDPRRYPAPLRTYLAEGYGSAARGKAIVMKYHRTVGALAYALSSAALCLAVACTAHGREAQLANVWSGVAAVALAAAATLGPSLARRRFPLPRFMASPGGGLQLQL